MRHGARDCVDVFIDVCGTFCGTEYTSLALWCWTGRVVDVASIARVRKGLRQATHFWCAMCMEPKKGWDRRLVVVGWQREFRYVIIGNNTLCGYHTRRNCMRQCMDNVDILRLDDFQTLQLQIILRSHPRQCVCFICDKARTDGHVCE